MAYKGLKIQVGDLVKCVNANGVIGLVIQFRSGATPLGRPLFDVLIGSESYPFLPHQLEVINARR